MKFVVCIQEEDFGDFSGDGITVGRLYEVIEEEPGNGTVRIVDESGEDYLCPASWFEPVAIAETAAARLHRALTTD
jgi:hypothetical protein